MRWIEVVQCRTTSIQFLFNDKNILPHFKNTRENILQCLDEYYDQKNLLSAFNNERFYKCEFCDGVKMIMEILEKSKQFDVNN